MPELNASTKKLMFDVGTLYTSSEPINMETIDFSALTTDTKLFGLTKGGMEFTGATEVRNIEFDGSRERAIKGMQRVVGGNGALKVTGLELGEEQLLFNLMDKTSGTKYDIYKPKKSGLLEATDYKHIMYVGKTSDGLSAVLIVKNAFSAEGFTLKTEDKSEGSYEMNVQGTWELNEDLSDKDVPFEIYLQKPVSPQGVSNGNSEQRS